MLRQIVDEQARARRHVRPPDEDGVKHLPVAGIERLQQRYKPPFADRAADREISHARYADAVQRAAIRLGDGNWPQYRSTRLVSNVLVPVCSPALIRPSRPADFAWLADQTILVSRARSDDWHLWCDAAGVDYGRLLRKRELESSALAYQAAIEGNGVALAQRVLVETELEQRSLMLPHPTEVDRDDSTYYLVGGPDGHKERLISQLRAFLTGSACTGVARNESQSRMPV
jgi:DNA-binding transcriptional LysR family regulator